MLLNISPPSEDISQKSKIISFIPGHIIFLDFLLLRLESNALVNALHKALAVVLETQIYTKIDYENVHELTQLLSFVGRNRINDRCTIFIVKTLSLRGQILNVEQARRIIWALSSVKLPEDLDYYTLLGRSLNVLKINFANEEFEAINTTLQKMVQKFLTDRTKFDKFYDEQLYSMCAEFVVLNDLGFEEATFIQRALNKVVSCF